jgi:GNAT superfamily N-acetyltransferase
MGDVAFTAVDPDDTAVRDALGAYMEEVASRMRIPALAQGTDDSDEYREPGGVFVVARDETGIVACAALRRLGADLGEVRRMWVRPDRRGSGLGAGILAEVEARAATLGYARLRLDTNKALTPAITMYESRGYRPIPRYNDNPDATNFYEKRLRRAL